MFRCKQSARQCPARAPPEGVPSYRAKLALLTAAIFVCLSLAIVNLVTKAQFVLSMPSE